MLDPIFTEKKSFEQAFSQGLASMLENDELGVFILVLANALADEKLWGQFKPALITKFEKLKAGDITGAEDDVIVFNQLLNLDLNDLEVTKYKTLGAFELQYNPLRALRPQRMSTVKTTGMSLDFDDGDFNFNKPFLKKETFWQGDFFSKNISIFYNKFPFAKLHGLIVVEPSKQHSQLLTPELHQFAWMMANSVGLNIEGFTLAYNSYGAYASVNHFHLQCFVRDTPLPIESNEKHPLINHWFNSVGDAWEFIDSLHRDNQPYHLIYRDQAILCIVRQRQDDYQHADWTSGYAWYEACGGLSTYTLDDFDQLTKQQLDNELTKLKIS
jgi:hypothetical protein